MSTRKLTMRVNIRKFNPDVGDYPRIGGVEQIAQLSLKYKGMECTTGVLPTDIPIDDPNADTHKSEIIIDSRRVLGGCWNVDVSSGEETMIMKLKLPPNSPIAVSKVRVIDESNTSRCWTSYRRNKDSWTNYNLQNNQWVEDKPFMEYRNPSFSNNFDECMIET